MVTLSDILYAFALSMALNGCAGSASAAGSTGILRSISRRIAARSRCTLMPNAALIVAVLDLKHQRALLRQRAAHAVRGGIEPADALDIEIVLLRPVRRHGVVAVACARRIAARDRAVVLRVPPVLQPHQALRARQARAVAGREDIRIGGAALRVDDDAVLHLKACGCRERVVRLHAGADHDHVSDEQIALAGFQRDRAVELRRCLRHRRRQLELDAAMLMLGEDQSRRFPRRRRAP